jgi:predicted DNA-binding transcriptional regulator AlpA
MSRNVDAAIAAIEKAGGLVAPNEIAEERGVTKEAVYDRIRRGNFPPPVKEVGRVKLYLREQIEPYWR